MDFDIQTWVSVAAFMGGGLSMGLGAMGAAIGEGYTAAKANAVMLRNPEMGGDIFKTMLVGQAIAESASIFALVVAIILLFTHFESGSLLTISALLGAGLSMGFSAIGSGVGSGFPSAEACEGIARQPETIRNVTNVMLIGQAVTQTPATLGLLISCILIFKEFPATDSVVSAAALLGSGLCMGLGAIGPGIGEGLASSGGVKWVARNQTYTANITRLMLIGMAVAESTAIYSLVVALLLIFVV
ncbi:ATP synthase F0 subunit C [Desulfonema magnum]|uniref:ATP synthase subunit c n=1 Tax=Desulfonema magnum TaxID=45655 RepID=A0A975GSF6_9BACT|nr:ATP synthase F0 subunit C [Desulfonema magnum]QTA91994.1 ATP synthase, subunit gamma (ATP synthase F0 sector subunit c) [Desulfonema magnum]